MESPVLRGTEEMGSLAPDRHHAEAVAREDRSSRHSMNSVAVMIRMAIDDPIVSAVDPIATV